MLRMLVWLIMPFIPWLIALAATIIILGSFVHRRWPL